MSDTCEIYCYDEEKVSRLKQALTGIDTEKTAAWFKALSDETRLKIIHVLQLGGEVCVCDVANAIGSTVANASHHLRLLKHWGIAKVRKEGKLVFYSLERERLASLLADPFISKVQPAELEVSPYV